MKSKESISVCIATYNGSKYIENQLNSILNQIGEEDEVIIVDDFSTDDTILIIKNLNDKRIKLYNNHKNIGAVQSFGRALQLAQGDLIFLSDQDDSWCPNKVSSIVGIFLTQSVDLIVHDAVVVDSRSIISHSLFEMNNSGQGIFKNTISNTYTGCCMSFRREILEKVLPIPKKAGLYHDAWIGIIAECSNFKIIFLKSTLIDWNRHGGNLSVTVRRNIITILFERFLLIRAILNRLIKNRDFIIFNFIKK
jgi:glycosyltransferase involved in cell wall biosynthesis